MRRALLAFDNLWCGKALFPAALLQSLFGESIKASSLALWRFFSVCALFAELVGLYILLYGALFELPFYFFAGVLLKFTSHFTAGIWHNQAGINLNLWWTSQLALIKKYQREFSGILSQQGLTEAEIQSIPLLPNELYSSELSSYPFTYLLNMLTPLVCTAALIMHGDHISAGLIAALGLAAIPLGKYFFQEFSFRQQREQRLAISAEAMHSFADSLKRHLRLTMQVNVLTQFPLLLFALLFSLGIGKAIFGSYIAFTMGLAGLSGLLAFQKLGVAGRHVTEKATHLINILSNDKFLISQANLKKHFAGSEPQFEAPTISNGVELKAFAPISLGTRPHSFTPLCIAIPAGGYYVFQAPSGYGKSIFILALLHLIEHTGDILYINEGVVTNIHDMPSKPTSSMVYFREQDICPSARLVDIFREPLQIALAELMHVFTEQFGPQLTKLAWDAQDNLIEKEIEVLENKKRSPFPARMLAYLSNMRRERLQLLEKWLASNFMESAMPAPVSVFSTLSAGEKQRIVNLLTLETAGRRQNARLVILDEPFAHLDEISIARQLGNLAHFQQHQRLPLLLITHSHVDKIKCSL